MGSILSAAPPTSIVPNGFGTSVSNAGGIYDITGGFAPGNGSNLFHSFSTFNLGTGDTADFDVSSNVTNIIARVTGGGSTIDGTITSTIGPGGPVSNANLFLINPAGIMFTANASLNLNGAFVATTANYIKFSDGSQFYGDLTHPLNDAGLTSAPVSAFGFISLTPAPISFEGTQFSSPGDLQIIGGGITFDEGSSLTTSGNLTVFGAASAGEVPFSLASPGTGFASATNTSYGNITIQNQSTLAVNGSGGGNLVIRGGQILVDDSSIFSNNSASAQGENISVQAQQLVVEDDGQIVSTSSAAGNGGSITLQASQLAVGYGGQIESYATSSGNAGALDIQSQNLLIYEAPSAIESFNYDDNENGAAGNVTVNVDGPIDMEAGEIDSLSYYSNGNAGNVQVTAQSLIIYGEQGNSYGISANSNSEDTPHAGNAGSVTIDVTGAIQLFNYGYVITDSYNAGIAGAISITAGSLSLNNSGISSRSEHANSLTSGTIDIDVTGALTISGGQGISTTTQTVANAGDITVTARSLILDGVGSNIESDASNEGTAPGGGNAGSVILTIDGGVTVTNGAKIESSSSTSGEGGSISISARSVDVLDDGAISASSAISDAGDIQIRAWDLTLDSGNITTSAGEDGGSITLNVQNIFYLNGGEITSSAGSAVTPFSTSTGTVTTGGNITIDPLLLVLSDGTISASDPSGSGGKITIIGDNYLNQSMFITATGGVSNGVVSISAPDLNLAGSLLPLPAALVTDENRLKESCSRSVNHDYSSLIVVGRGGTELGPDELQPDFGAREEALPTIR